MSNESTAVLEHALEADLFTRYPLEAAGLLEPMSPAALADTLAGHDAKTLAPVFEAISPAILPGVIARLPDELVAATLNRITPGHATAVLRVLNNDLRARLLELLTPTMRADVDLMLDCAPESAGAVMDPRVIFLRRRQRVADAIARLREERYHQRYVRAQRIMLVVDDEGRLEGIVAIQDLALAGPDDTIGDYMQAVPAFVTLSATTEEMVDTLKQHSVSSLPVVDDQGHLAGVVRYEQLVAAAQETASVDLQTMFGASRDEKALSKPSFAVKKRLPWLQINLVTAFLAAAVVGVFEQTIATYTALAVLLPVVAGQSGNTGAQALAVVIRGLALREISAAHWRRVVFKETLVAAVNGVAVALTTALGVYVWSRSVGLALVIAVSMVISMAIAGTAGAAIPLILTRIGQDPAQSSSIILTTVTDVAGFFSFLGIATLFIALL